jgi:hypothetical protein
VAVEFLLEAPPVVKAGQRVVLRQALELFLEFLALGDVAGGGIDQLLVGNDLGCPLKPAIRAIFCHVAIHEADHLGSFFVS